jgi:hypothetical protein
MSPKGNKFQHRQVRLIQKSPLPTRPPAGPIEARDKSKLDRIGPHVENTIGSVVVAAFAASVGEFPPIADPFISCARQSSQSTSHLPWR